MKKNTTFEVCPFCEEEVELNAELMVQTCPHCGKRIVACSMCRASEDTEHNYCTHCCLDYQARVENEEANWLGIRPKKAEDKPELAEKPKEPFIVMTREMSLLGETIQDITLSAWPIVWDNNKYDQDSREVLEMLRDWAVEFENWWYGHDQDWRDANCWSIEVEDYTIRKSKEYVKELQERISK